MGSRYDDLYKFKSDDVLTDAALNLRFKDLDARATQIEIARLSETEAFDVVLDRVLSRSEAVISSLRDRLLTLTELQWLTAHSDTARTLAIEAQFSLSIIEADRPLFAPGPFAVLSWSDGDPSDYAVVRTLGFDRGIGQWDIRVEAFVGDPGPHADWRISAVAGSTLAQLALLEDGQAVAAAVHADQQDVETKHAEVVSMHADVLAMAGDTAGAAGFDGRIAALEASDPATRLTALELQAARLKGRRRLFSGSLI